ncbi:RNA polymerase sigma factor [Streptomyces sp. NPDC006285]|uniref:RNA polymerase sigma factor n=1 Tax=Streptomyces sp. NPDC006285 TaxID=3364742 RepID=UPI0036757537
MTSTCAAMTSSMPESVRRKQTAAETTTDTTAEKAEAVADHMTAAEFDEAFTAAMPRLRNRLLAMTGNPHDADDLLQETYLRLSRRAHARVLARQDHPYAYTCAAALNLLRDSWLRPSRREHCTDRMPEQSWDGGFAAREAAVVTLALLRGLSPKEAAAVILVDIEGLSHDLAGERLGAHRGTVQRNRMRGLAKIRAEIDAYETPSGRVSMTKDDGPAHHTPTGSGTTDRHPVGRAVQHERTNHDRTQGDTTCAA